MCRAVFIRCDSSTFYWTLACSTNADVLYDAARDVGRWQGASLFAIEPCLMMFATAIAPAPEVGDELDQAADADCGE